eukprot:11849179-Alexandrium_andersonii.AAC.1
MKSIDHDVHPALEGRATPPRALVAEEQADLFAVRRKKASPWTAPDCAGPNYLWIEHSKTH